MVGDKMNYNKKKSLLFGFLKGIQAEFFGIFIMLFFWSVMKLMGFFANIIFGFCGAMCVVCVLGDFCIKEGRVAKDKVTLRNDKVSSYFGFLQGFVAGLPSLIAYILLILSKMGIIGNFLPAFKIINAPFFALIDIVAHTADINKAGIALFIMGIFFPVVYILSAGITFKIGFDKVDVKEKVMYK